MEHRKFDSNSVYCCLIFRPKFPIILQFYQSFINIYSLQWKLANKNEINIKRMKKYDMPSKYVTKRKMTSANIWQ